MPEVDSILVINKSDLSGVHQTISQLESVLNLNKKIGEVRLVLKIQANKMLGIEKLIEECERKLESVNFEDYHSILHQLLTQKFRIINEYSLYESYLKKILRFG